MFHNVKITYMLLDQVCKFDIQNLLPMESSLFEHL